MKRLRVEGFIATDYAPRFGEAIAELSTWAAAGTLRQRSYEIHGFDRLPDALRELVGGRLGNPLVFWLVSARRLQGGGEILGGSLSPPPRLPVHFRKIIEGMPQGGRSNNIGKMVVKVAGE